MLERFAKHTIQTFGGALIVLGILLITVGLFGIYSSKLRAYCPAGGCLPYSLPAQNWLLVASLLSGIALVIVGIVLLNVAREMKSKRDTDEANAQYARAN